MITEYEFDIDGYLIAYSATEGHHVVRHCEKLTIRGQTILEVRVAEGNDALREIVVAYLTKPWSEPWHPVPPDAVLPQRPTMLRWDEPVYPTRGPL